MTQAKNKHNKTKSITINLMKSVMEIILKSVFNKKSLFKTQIFNLKTMKQLIITGMLCIAFLFTQQSNAQVDAGIVVGTGFSEVIGDNAIGYNKMAFTAGLQTDVHLSDKLALSSGLMFAQKGSQISEKFQTNSTFPAHTTLNYVQAPLMLKIKSEYGLFFSGGVTFARLLNAELTSFNGAEKPSYEDIESQFKPWEIGATAQFGYKISPTLQVAGGWAQSINNIFSGDIEGKNALQNNQFNVQLTFFPFATK